MAEELFKILENHQPELAEIMKELVSQCADKFEVTMETNFGRITFKS